MLGAVDLHKLAHTVPAIAGLVNRLEPLLAVAPEIFDAVAKVVGI
jgi:hypothetical protein